MAFEGVSVSREINHVRPRVVESYHNGAAWTDERVATLRRLWGEGYSASQIAKEIGGVTRNAVIGKIHRLGLGGRTTHSRTYTRPKNALARLSRASHRARGHKPMAPKALKKAREYQADYRARQYADAIARSVALEPLGPPGERAVLALETGQCRFPIGDPKADDFAFCCRPATGSYCADHQRLTYQPGSRAR